MPPKKRTNYKRYGARLYSEDYEPCFGSRLEQLMIDLNVSNRWFAKQIGSSEHNLSHWLNMERAPSIDILLKICKTFNVSADWLLGLKEDK